MNKKIHYSWFMFIGCCIMQFTIVGAVINGAGLFYTPICDELGFGRGELALYNTISSTMMALAAPFWGKVMNKLPIKPLLAGCLITDSVALLALSRATQLWHWYVAGFFMGIANSVLCMLITPVILNNWFQKNLGLVTGIAMSFSGIGGAVINPVNAAIIEKFGWRTAQTVVALMPVVLVLPFVLMFYYMRPEDKGIKAFGAEESVLSSKKNALSGMTLQQALKSVLFPLVIVYAALGSFGAGFPNFLSSIAVSLGKTMSYGATLASMAMIGNIAGKLVLGWINDKFGIKMASASATIFLLVCHVCLFAGVQGNVSLLLSAGAFLSGTAMSLSSVMIPLISKYVFGEKEYSSIYSYVSMGSSLAIAAASSIIGFTYDIFGTYAISSIIALVIYTICLLSVFVIFKMKDKESAAQ